MLTIFVVTFMLVLNPNEAVRQSLQINSVWNGGFHGSFTIHPGHAIIGWTAHLSFSKAVQTLEIFKATILSSSNGNRDYFVQNVRWDGNVTAEDSLTVDFTGTMVGDQAPTGTVTLTEVTVGGSSNHVTNPTTLGPAIPQSTNQSVLALNTKYDYAEALRLSILFYAAQRSGKLPANNPIPWRGDSALQDGHDVHTDLTGGWYDAGDLIKFNFPMASTTTLLVWGLIRWPDAYQAAGQLDNMYDSVKWPLDYFLKCWKPSRHTLYIQCGNGHAGHDYWGRPEDMNPNRPTYKVTAQKPGSDVAGETAAAMAAGSIAFQSKDTVYANRLLTASRSLYVFAKSHRGKYSDSVHDVHEFYASSGYEDELCTAAAWLYKATNETHYLTDAQQFYDSDTAYALSWDDKQISCQVLLWELTGKAKYKTSVQHFLHNYMPGGNVPYTPCGLVFRAKWGSLAFAANAAFVALMASEDGIGGADYKTWALSQIDYALGENNHNFSYEIGFGSKYPVKPHHVGSSCPSPPATCDWDAFNSHAPNPHILYGALVGGPGHHDDYTDDRKDYVKNEVACDYNSGFQSALAGLVHFALQHDLPAAPTLRCSSRKRH
ncbi:endoglucanase 13-like [Mizuhopecten yessoensis]|uniref:Endoglucanase n=1 Tax=Mizuhopecten yessoensis TaxID=6573 RepID=A0A210QD93_MIZYE|nr:endoglucanase 13-like [Mizuhopecten yessoensis]OWF46713.1 Endoglucanase E-4 [Mizuhopecten yessoensis]